MGSGLVSGELGGNKNTFFGDYYFISAYALGIARSKLSEDDQVLTLVFFFLNI